MLWLGVDFETTGLDTKKDRVTEIGAVLWDTEKKVPVIIFNKLVWDETYPEITPEITKLTGIDLEILKAHGENPIQSWASFLALADKADVLIAHNGTNFDRPIMEAELSRNGLIPSSAFEWIDSSVDFPYPEEIQTRKLVHLAAEHGFVNPFAHRAVFDVLTMLTVLAEYDAKEVLALSKVKSITIRAVVTYEAREQAKAKGYRWNAERKIWVKTIKETQLEKEKQAPFNIHVLEGIDG